MPGNGTYTNGKTYTGTSRPSFRLTAAQVAEAPTATLKKWYDALNDAYDFDAVDAMAFHNMDLVSAELKKRNWK